MPDETCFGPKFIAWVDELKGGFLVVMYTARDSTPKAEDVGAHWPYKLDRACSNTNDESGK